MEEISAPQTSATPGRQDRHESHADDVNMLYRKAMSEESARRQLALRIGLATLPLSVSFTTGLGIYLGMSLMGLALLAIIGLSCSPGLAVTCMTAHKVFWGRPLKKRVMKQAKLLGLTKNKARFLWKAVCHQLDALDRENLSQGSALALFSQKKNPKLQEVVIHGEVPWDDKTLLSKSLPGV